MPRPKRKQINLTNESALSLMQEIYNECVEQRTTAIRIQNKMISFMKEAADMSLIGPVLKEQQKIIDSAIEKKLQLSKLLTSITTKNMGDGTTSSFITDDLKERINELVQKSDDNDTTVNYKM